MNIEFFYDLTSPYSYLAMTQIERIEDATRVPVQWRPFFLGGVFKATGNAAPALVPSRGKHMVTDLMRWAERYNVPMRFPSRFPMNTLPAMRALLGVEDEERGRLSLALGHAYWAEDADLSDPAVLNDIMGAEAVARAAEFKDALRANTDEAVSRGAFGAPTFFVDDQMFFGNDRIDFVIDAALS